MKMYPKIKKLKVPLLITGITLITVATVGLAANLASFYLTRKYMSAHDGCLPVSTHHNVTNQHGVVPPPNTDTKRCETLTITNLDRTRRIMAFGQHDHHITYDGITEEPLIKDQSLTVTLIKTGDFKFHDHANDEVKGTFSVAP